MLRTPILMRRKNTIPDRRKARVIVNVGSNITEVIVHRGDLPLFIRTTVVGSDAVTKALSEKLGIPLPAADRLKEALGL